MKWKEGLDNIKSSDGYYLIRDLFDYSFQIQTVVVLFRNFDRYPNG